MMYHAALLSVVLICGSSVCFLLFSPAFSSLSCYCPVAQFRSARVPFPARPPPSFLSPTRPAGSGNMFVIVAYFSWTDRTQWCHDVLTLWGLEADLLPQTLLRATAWQKVRCVQLYFNQSTKQTYLHGFRRRMKDTSALHTFTVVPLLLF